jgi:hypothetical protein
MMLHSLTLRPATFFARFAIEAITPKRLSVQFSHLGFFPLVRVREQLTQLTSDAKQLTSPIAL